MKNVLLAIISMFAVQFSYSQIVIDHWCFDPLSICTSSPNEANLYIDSVINPNNSWQIGAPQKLTFTNAYSTPNVIVTDTLNPYPVNDTSAFYIGYTTTESSTSIHWDVFQMEFYFFVDSDTLTDKGLIEFSVDNGITWIDLINDPAYENYRSWFVDGSGITPPVLTGSSGGWKRASVILDGLALYLNIPAGTYIQWRFSFVSDSVQNNRDGLMYDDILLYITPPIGIEEVDLYATKKLVKVLDLLGRETEETPNTPLIYLYEDGSARKVFRVVE